jgi:hypothetical protein
MLRLYRSPHDLEHWFGFDDAAGWMRFPARIGGWAERRPVRTVSGLALREVPLWLSFNTGLQADRRGRRLHLAA